MYTKKSKRVGYSKKITDPAFKKYLNQSKSWSLIFSLILATFAAAGFFIYGETSSEMNNPQALYVGLGIGSMFVIIAVFQIISRKTSKDWDGSVIDKKIEKKTRKNKLGEREDFVLFTIIIRSYNGKIHEICDENDDTVYNYYKIGDKVRHHRGLNTLEKFDKSKDTIIFCNACASLNDIEDDYCHRCKCPLLK
ncbi:MAG: hypothetical protein R6U59_05070 [Eubacteriales bacterium]